MCSKKDKLMKEELNIDLALDRLKAHTANQDTNLSYERLIHKIATIQKERAPKNLVLSTLVLITLMICLNVFLLIQKNDKHNKDNNLANKMGLVTNNSIYGGI